MVRCRSATLIGMERPLGHIYPLVTVLTLLELLFKFYIEFSMAPVRSAVLGERVAKQKLARRK